MSNADTVTNDRQSGVVFGLIILFGWAMFLYFTTQHAENGPPASFVALIRGMATEGQQMVHAGVCVASAILLIGYAGFATRLGLGRPSVMTGLVIFTIATVALVVWALLDGIVLPGLAIAYAKKPDDFLEVLKPTYFLTVGIVSLMSQIRMIIMPIAIVAWSISLLQQSAISRFIGLLGFGAAVLIAAPVFAPQVMKLAGSPLMAFLALSSIQAAWGALIALQMIRGKI